ncbi:MAG: hypothetical protein HBSAPP03_10670 [Phycisphaerae bacterium]|nr:MAG: hypothetical protein HBSAPP03_10670 [Phycisphaerae bacterium]
MTRTLIWDLPVRIFHGLLVAGLGSAGVIALALDDDSALFPYHALIGLTLALLVALRIVWGFVGTRYARFGSFWFSPRAVVAYMKGASRGGGTRHLGHNPASAYVILLMLLLVAALAVTGVLLGRGYEGVKDIHEVCAYALAAAAGVHVLGVALHTIRYRENITASMVHGRKQADPGAGIPSARPMAAVVLVLLAGAWAWALVSRYDAPTRTVTIPVLGVSLRLGDAERDEPRTPRPAERRAVDDDEDHDE